MKNPLWRRMAPGDKMPRFQRIAYFDHRQLLAITVLIGPHWVVKLIRRIWERSLLYRPSRFERYLDDCHSWWQKGREASISKLFDEFKER